MLNSTPLGLSELSKEEKLNYGHSERQNELKFGFSVSLALKTQVPCEPCKGQNSSHMCTPVPEASSLDLAAPGNTSIGLKTSAKV